MHSYRKILVLLKALLAQGGLTHWEELIDADINEWDTCGNSRRFKGHFGGMGSINDISISTGEGYGSWSNTLFDLLKSIGYEYAHKEIITLNFTVPSVINGAICRNCSHAEIDHSGLERFLSETFLPDFIDARLESDDYLSLLNVANLATAPQVTDLRNKLTSAMLASHIAFVPRIEILRKGCPQCFGTDICVYDWNVVSSNSVIQLGRSRNNLRIKADGPPWWRFVFKI